MADASHSWHLAAPLCMNDSPTSHDAGKPRWPGLLSKIAFYHGMIMANGFALGSVALLCMHATDLGKSNGHLSLGALFLVLAVFSLGLAWLASSCSCAPASVKRIAKRD